MEKNKLSWYPTWLNVVDDHGCFHVTLLSRVGMSDSKNLQSLWPLCNSLLWFPMFHPGQMWDNIWMLPFKFYDIHKQWIKELVDIWAYFSLYHNAVKKLLCFIVLSEGFKSWYPWCEEPITNSNQATTKDAQGQPEGKQYGQSKKKCKFKSCIDTISPAIKKTA